MFDILIYTHCWKANSPNMLLSSLVPTSERTVNFWEHPTGDFAIFAEMFGLKYKVLHIVRLSTYSRWVLGEAVDNPRFVDTVSILKTLLVHFFIYFPFIYTFWVAVTKFFLKYHHNYAKFTTSCLVGIIHCTDSLLCNIVQLVQSEYALISINPLYYYPSSLHGAHSNNNNQ